MPFSNWSDQTVCFFSLVNLKRVPFFWLVHTEGTSFFSDLHRSLNAWPSCQHIHQTKETLVKYPWHQGDPPLEKGGSEKAMATHSSTLAWKIPWMEGPGGLQSMGSLGVGHDWATSLSLFTFIHWRRKWQPTPVFLPGESQGRRSLVGCSLWDRTESDTTEAA